jgi:hypothetical protein
LKEKFFPLIWKSSSNPLVKEATKKNVAILLSTSYYSIGTKMSILPKSTESGMLLSLNAFSI